MHYLTRLAEDKFEKLNKIFPVVFVSGPRQVGKTTMLKKMCAGQNRTYVTLDDLNARELALSDPKLFFQTYQTPILIDEIQYAPNLFAQIKIMADNHQTMGEFWLTGSQSYRIMKNVSESLAGRIGIMQMAPLTQQEILCSKHANPTDFSFENLSQLKDAPTLEIKDVFTYIFNGGMPKLQSLGGENRADYYHAYLNTYLMRDIMELGKITDTVKFAKFLNACAAQVSCVINYANLASAADISQPTAKEWVNLLQGLGIIFLLEPYYNNTLKRLTKTPKLYFYDSGLCTYLAKLPSAESLQVSAFAGAYFENYVVSQLKIKYELLAWAPNLYFYRDIDQHEIDLLLEDAQGLTPLEIKLSANPNRHDLQKFAVLTKLGKNIQHGGIICLIDRLFPCDAKNAFIPVGMI